MRRIPRPGGLDALNFFVANLQTGFGPFIAVYLTTHKWTQVEIGTVLSVAAAASLVGQVPGGAIVDALRRKRTAATLSLVAIAVSAAALGAWPARLPVILAESLHSIASCVLVPAIAAVTLNQVTQAQVAERLGRNGRFAALGNAAGAALMGAVGTWVSSRAVFWLAALLCLPAVAAVRSIPPAITRPGSAYAGAPDAPRHGRRDYSILLDRRLLAFAGCAVLFHLANAAMLPMAAERITATAGGRANIIIAACLVVPQFIVAALAPGVGRAAERFGRRAVLIGGFLALPARALLFAAVSSPMGIVLVQALDGVGGAVFGVMVPLVCADITRGTRRFNTCVGAIGLGVSIGAIVSTWAAGAIATEVGNGAAFLALAGAGAAAVAAVALFMPETRPAPSAPPSPDA